MSKTCQRGLAYLWPNGGWALKEEMKIEREKPNLKFQSLKKMSSIDVVFIFTCNHMKFCMTHVNESKLVLR